MSPNPPPSAQELSIPPPPPPPSSPPSPPLHMTRTRSTTRITAKMEHPPLPPAHPESCDIPPIPPGRPLPLPPLLRPAPPIFPRISPMSIPPPPPLLPRRSSTFVLLRLPFSLIMLFSFGLISQCQQQQIYRYLSRQNYIFFHLLQRKRRIFYLLVIN